MSYTHNTQATEQADIFPLHPLPSSRIVSSAVLRSVRDNLRSTVVELPRNLVEAGGAGPQIRGCASKSELFLLPGNASFKLHF